LRWFFPEKSEEKSTDAIDHCERQKSGKDQRKQGRQRDQKKNGDKRKKGGEKTDDEGCQNEKKDHRYKSACK